MGKEGSVWINGDEIRLKKIDEYVDMTARRRRHTKKWSRRMKKCHIRFRLLKQGINEIEFSSRIDFLEITPRWWQI